MAREEGDDDKEETFRSISNSNLDPILPIRKPPPFFWPIPAGSSSVGLVGDDPPSCRSIGPVGTIFPLD